jgi:hypothetical protein
MYAFNERIRGKNKPLISRRVPDGGIVTNAYGISLGLFVMQEWFQ